MAQRVETQRSAGLLAALLHGGLYGRDIRARYFERTGDDIPPSSLNSALSRLEQKGLIRSRLGDSGHEQGGSRRKYFKLTGAGLDALNDIQRSVMTRGVPANPVR